MARKLTAGEREAKQQAAWGLFWDTLFAKILADGHSALPTGAGA